jgi:hypothetical protein
MLTMGLTELIEGLGSAVLDTGGRLSAAEARRLACDSSVTPIVLGSDSMPLDVGRQQRLATPALRNALALAFHPGHAADRRVDRKRCS